MFDYMDVKTQEDARHISINDLYELSSGTFLSNYPRLMLWVNDARFWSDQCKAWFDIRPFDPNTAKSFFGAEYLFQIGNRKAAAEQHSFKALFYFYEKYCRKQKYSEALEVADLIAKHYGVVGIIIGLTIYFKIFENSAEEIDDAQQALNLLEIIDDLKHDEVSNHYFTELKWQEQMESHDCNSLDEYKTLVKEFFEPRVNQNVLAS